LNNQRVRFGIAPINWSNDDMPEIGGHYTLDTILSEMSEAGYSGTEVGNKFPKNASSIKKELNKYSLELASSWHSTFFLTKNTEAELSNVEQSCTVLNEVGAKTINIAECSKSIHGEIKTPLKDKPICDKKDWNTLADCLNRAGEICNSYGISLAYHHHMGTCIQNEDEINILLSNTDPYLLSLCADTGHLYFAGTDPVSFFKKNINRISHIHFKDLRSEMFNNLDFENDSFLKAVLSGAFTVPGDGCIDFNAISKIIIDSDYTGWIIVEAEQDPAAANPLEYALLSKKYLENIWSN